MASRLDGGRERARSNVRLALVLGAVALGFFVLSLLYLDWT